MEYTALLVKSFFLFYQLRRDLSGKNPGAEIFGYSGIFKVFVCLVFVRPLSGILPVFNRCFSETLSRACYRTSPGTSERREQHGQLRGTCSDIYASRAVSLGRVLRTALYHMEWNSRLSGCVHIAA